MAANLAARLQAERSRQFIGRTAELATFRQALSAPELPFCLWHIFGPGGIGKTTLMQALMRQCQTAAVPFAYVDARQIEAVSSSFLSALRVAMGLAETADICAAISAAIAQHPANRYVLFIDTYEQLSALDTWLHQIFLPELPAAVLIVLAGRQPPAPDWQVDAGWQAIIQPLALRNFCPEESQVYLTQRQVPAAEHDSILAFTHGHPLALSLVADIFAQGHSASQAAADSADSATKQTLSFQPDTEPDLVKRLLEKFVEQVPTSQHRQALEVCAVVRALSESLLSHLLAQPDVHALFDWLRSLSFIESQSAGLFPHDVVREVLAADLRWRAPDWYETLHARSRSYYSDRLSKTQGAEQHRVLFDYIFLHRDNSAIRPNFTWQETSSLKVTELRPSDLPALLAMVETHEGSASANLADYWLKHQPEGVLVFREADQQPAGFVCKVTLSAATAEAVQHDPATLVAWKYLEQHAPLRAGESAVMFRFWMAKDSYQAVSPTQSLIFITFVQHHRETSNLAFTFFPCAQPEAWAQMFAYADLTRLPTADFTVDNTYGVYGHDWRVVPPALWQTLLAQREMMPAATPSPVATSVTVLSRPDFEEAVRLALQKVTQLEALVENPLVRSRLIESLIESTTVPDATAADRATALQSLILEAANSLKTTPKQTKYYLALHHTYLQPAPTQEQAAEVLDLPFSTFRRHLKTGISEVTEFLWHRELGQ
jgi:hypothetical protein